eukprot:4464383-Pleurochrysis_carterae.AAC.1
MLAALFFLTWGMFPRVAPMDSREWQFERGIRSGRDPKHEGTSQKLSIHKQQAGRTVMHGMESSQHTGQKRGLVSQQIRMIGTVRHEMSGREKKRQKRSHMMRQEE